MDTLASRDLEIRHLLALDAVAAEGTFGRAADRLGYTQSAVSQQIAALERVVGGSLFDRPGGPRPVEITPLGRLLADHAREVLARIESAATDVRRFKEGVIGHLDIGTFQSVSTALLPTILNALRTERPELETRVLESDINEELMGRVIDGQLDASFVLTTDEAPELESVVLFDDPFVVVARPEDVDDGPVPVARLSEGPLIGQQDNTCQRFIDNGLRAAGCDPDYVFRSNDNGAVIAMVRAGMGLAVLAQLAVDENDARIVTRPLEPPIPPRRIALAWRRGRTMSPALERFIEITRDVSAGLPGRQPVLSATR